MVPAFSRSDDLFIELVHDQTKRTSAIAAYRKKRKIYFWLGILYGALAVPSLFFNTVCYFSIVFVAPFVLSTACFVLFLSLHAYFDNKIKLLLYIEEKAKPALQNKQ